MAHEDSGRPEEAAGIYVHLPFCISKCPYCDFSSVTDLTQTERVVGAIMTEAQQRSSFARSYDSLYIGGGTPSALAPELLVQLLLKLRSVFSLSTDLELTVELNPADVTHDLLSALADGGVNRLSLGVQSFDDQELRFLGRRHDQGGAVLAIETIAQKDAFSLGLDLIQALPGSVPRSGSESVTRALAFEPDHLSCYILTIADDTPFGRQRERGELVPLDDDAAAFTYLQNCELIERAGYVHYEVSNFARSENTRSRHNQKYWNRVPYLGLGPSAHSFDGSCRWANYSDLGKYCEALEAGSKPVAQFEELRNAQVRLEIVGLGLRTARGVALKTLHLQAKNIPIVRRLEEEGLIEIKDGMVCPTRRGFLVADGMARELV